MVGAELTKLVTEMLGTPGSDEYEAARIILNSRMKLQEAVVAAGLTKDMDALEKAETIWIFSTMPQWIQDKISMRVRVALNAGVPVIVAWNEGDWFVTADVADHADGMHLTLTTPIPDLAKLQSGAWFGSSLASSS